MTTRFLDKYGPTAIVAGASEGIGRAFSVELARRRFSLVLLARREQPLSALASELRGCFGVEVRTSAVDLGRPDILEHVAQVCRDVDVGLVVYNAALSIVGPFLDMSLDDRLREIDVNCRGPLCFAHHFGRKMVARGRGGIVLMSSLSGKQGTAYVSSYAATKAFDTVLAEGLWSELKGHGVDVLACEAGATRTPGFESTKPKGGALRVRPMEPEPVVLSALDALGKQPAMIPGLLNRLVFAGMRFVPRARAVQIISSTTRRMYET